MKKLTTLLLAIVLLWGCNEKPTSLNYMEKEGAFGSSVVNIPRLALAKIALSKVQYKFSLTITGTNMEPMRFDWPVDGSGATFTIDRIPAGSSRLFEGILYGSNGATYEGSAYVDIIGGQVANVSLVLRRTGSANVEVIIEDMLVPNKVEGCYSVSGRIGDIELSNLTLEIPASPDNQFWGYVKENDVNIGKFSGTVTNDKIDAKLYIETLKIDAVFKGAIRTDGKAFKGEVFSRKDNSPLGVMYGNSIACGVIPNKFEGCYSINGRVGDIELSGLTLEIPVSPDSQFWGSVKQNKVMVGKFFGTIINNEIDARLVVGELAIDVVYKGHVGTDGKAYKGEIFSRKDNTLIGNMYGNSIVCGVIPKDCIRGGIETVVCTDTLALIEMAKKECKSDGRILTTYEFISPCSKVDPSMFYGIKFEACKPMK